jgi:hypothetical protein
MVLHIKGHLFFILLEKKQQTANKEYLATHIIAVKFMPTAWCTHLCHPHVKTNWSVWATNLLLTANTYVSSYLMELITSSCQVSTNLGDRGLGRQPVYVVD